MLTYSSNIDLRIKWIRGNRSMLCKGKNIPVDA